MLTSLSLVLAFVAQTGQQQTRYIMGTWFSIEVPTETSLLLIDACFQIANKLDHLGTTYNDHSPLMMLRRGDPNFFEVAENDRARLLGFLERAVMYHRQSAGAFHPATGAQPYPLEPVMTAALQAAKNDRLLPLPWDLGAMLKGTAIDQMIEYLIDHGVSWALVNGGGDLRWYGKTQDLIIREPGEGNDNRPLLRIRLASGALATSANDRRFTITAKGREGHIKSPRPDFQMPLQQVSVLAHTAELADVWATAVFVAGPQFATTWSKRYDWTVVMLAEDGSLTFHGDKQDVFDDP